MTKHFPGGGPQKNGLDPHFEFQQGQVYPGNNFAYHLIPFEQAIASKTSAIMPYYGIPVDQTNENVGSAFNQEIVTGLLRNIYNYDGIISTDWGLITDVVVGSVVWPARAWGVEHLSVEQRVKKLLDAGVDQLGGESVPELIISLVNSNQISEERLDISVKRLLRQKFRLSLFDNPFVNVDEASNQVKMESSQKLGELTQRMAMTLLKNGDEILPLPQNKLNLYVQNLDPDIASQYGTIVDSPEEADLAIIRLNTPWYRVQTPNFISWEMHHGDLDFKGQEKDDILELLSTVPTIVDIYLDRPAVIPDIAEACKALLADFGASDEAILDVIFGNNQPMGKLPVELPSSMEAVQQQFEDLPYDSESPLYEFGYGLSYVDCPQCPKVLDIKPDDAKNKINVKKSGVIPVAILHSDEFDVTLIDPSSLLFGAGQAQEIHKKGHFKDVDNDGDLDLLLHFKLAQAKIECGDRKASLIGKSFTGDPIYLFDQVNTFGCAISKRDQQVVSGSSNTNLEVRLYPNPVDETLKVDYLESYLKNGRVAIISTHGEVKIIDSSIIGGSSYQVDTSQLAGGTYFFVITIDGNIEVVRKFTVSH